MNSYTRAFTYEKPSRLMINTMQSGMSRDKRMIPYLTGPPSIGAPRAFQCFGNWVRRYPMLCD